MSYCALFRLSCNVARPTFKSSAKKILNIEHLNKTNLSNVFKNGSKRWTATLALDAKVVSDVAVPRVVGWWMGGIAGMCFGAVVLGGVTRLTESGLSMVDWKLLGRPPPMDEGAWQIEYEKYRESPEFKYKNSEITLNDFKFIWMMEYGHRMWGRTIGAFYYIPATLMLAAGYFTPAIKKRVALGGVFLLCQGLMGWYMVKSGLDHKNFEGPNDIPRVSQYRLAAHLSAAMVLYSFMLWNSLSILKPPKKFTMEKLSKNDALSLVNFRRLAMTTKGLVFVTAISGAFVAGLDAGLVYNSFPLMAGKVIPDDIFAYAPWLSNFTENPTTVQFDHRILGTTTLGVITAMYYKSRQLPLPAPARKAALAVLCMGWMQVGLGITTLLTYVPVHIAAMHQSGALVTLSTALWLSHELKLMKVLKHVPK